MNEIGMLHERQRCSWRCGLRCSSEHHTVEQTGGRRRIWEREMWEKKNGCEAQPFVNENHINDIGVGRRTTKCEYTIRVAAVRRTRSVSMRFISQLCALSSAGVVVSGELSAYLGNDMFRHVRASRRL